MSQVIFDENHLYDAGCFPAYWYNNITCERIPYYCGSARCFRPECVNSWARKRLAICNDLIKKIGKPRFFTLTIDRSHELSEAWNMISTWWADFRHRVRRWLKKLDMPKMKFFAVLEAHEDGYPHIHGFWNFYIPKSVLSNMWSKSAPGYVVDVQAVDDYQIASDYLFTELGRYLGKEQSIQGARMAGHRKRTFWRSKGLYTNYELDRQQPGLHNGEWQLITKGARNGKKKLIREDLEGTCSAATAEGTSTGCPNMETEVSAHERSEGETLAGAEGEDQRRNPARKGEVVYGYKEAWYEVDSERTKSRKGCLSDYGIP